ncbi:ribosome silencing factor [Candidatus Endowatersipora endosymbiont of Watersipora subatra]|uniref:ribosome silencing factor n=1 Tax=Candidatus Endowatersipora endosymbiont of Watersipora subatra TaxID=3077946 RepID=UPI00312C7692
MEKVKKLNTTSQISQLSSFQSISDKKNLRSDTLITTIQASLDNSKAEAINCINTKGTSSLADYIVITSGRSHQHVKAITNRLIRDLKENEFRNLKVEGLPACDWVLVDSGNAIVHIFRPEVRRFYNLEKGILVPTSESINTCLENLI